MSTLIDKLRAEVERWKALAHERATEIAALHHQPAAVSWRRVAETRLSVIEGDKRVAALQDTEIARLKAEIVRLADEVARHRAKDKPKPAGYGVGG